MMFLALVAIAAWHLGGCLAVFVPPVGLNLASAGLSDYSVEAGVPTQKTGSFLFSAGGIPIGSGSLRIDPADVSVTPAGSEGDKRAVAMQDNVVTLDDLLQAESCLEACEGAGVDAEVCSDVCREGLIVIFLFLTSTDDTECASGNEYEVRITLNDEVQVTDVSISPNEFIGNTVELLNSGEFRICIEVLAGFDADIGLETLTLVLGG
jgi:hypothetical protein